MSVATVTSPRVRRPELFRSGRGLAGVSILIAMLLLVVVGPLLAPHDPTATSGDTGAGPSSAHLLGTDTLGRDIFSRVLSGGGTVIGLPLVAVVIGLTIGATIGILAGYLGGPLDAVATRVFDVQLAIPGILLALLIVTGFGRGDGVVVAAVALVEIPRFARVLRPATQSVAARDYVLAARARGEGLRWIVFGEILPGVLPTFLTEAALGLTAAVLAIASLSFLGLGVQQPTPNWAVMVSENRELLFTHPFGGVIVPALLMALLAIGINLTVDAMTRSGA
ncbi:MAG TPA: ABC transporter permease [Gaiellaceae bacterium]|nr:ABC transporter permease [Gaiellaceae bacterium]